MDFYGLMIITPLHCCDAPRGFSHLPRRWSWEPQHDLDAEFLLTSATAGALELDQILRIFGHSSHEDFLIRIRNMGFMMTGWVRNRYMGYPRNPIIPLKSWTCQKKHHKGTISSSHEIQPPWNPGIHRNPLGYLDLL